MRGIWTIDKIKGEHERLYAQLLTASAPSASPVGAKVEAKYLADVQELLRQIQVRAAEDSLTSDYTALINAMQQWQVAFSTLLEIDPKVLGDMPLSIPNPPKLIGPPSVSIYDEIMTSMEYSAKFISVIRRTREAQNVLERISSKEQQNTDWYHAEVLFGTQVTEGARDLISVPPQCFCYLENAWFRDVIQLKAYFLWENEGANLDADPKVAYYKARQFYRDRLAAPEKRGALEFTYIGTYLQDKYLHDESMVTDTAKTKSLKERKARQFCEIKGYCGDDYNETNWDVAARFVDLFYDNIMLAIRDGDEQGLNNVWEAIALSEGDKSNLSIMNAFEASIVLYFLKDYHRFPGAWR